MAGLKTFLSELSKIFNISLVPDAHGACLVMMKAEQIQLLFEYDDIIVPNTILMSSSIGSVPHDRSSELYESILKENSRIEETLSVKPEDELLYLHRRVHPNIQARELQMIITSFTTKVKEWREKLSQVSFAATKKEAATPIFPDQKV